MSLVISMDETPEDIIINGSHKAFEGTPMEGADFEIVAKPVSREEYARIQRKHSKFVRGLERVDSAAVAVEMFVFSVKSWRGLVDKKSGQPLPCDEKTKRHIAIKNWSFASNVTGAVLEEMDSAMVERKEELGNC
jgi:hypothetical protein